MQIVASLLLCLTSESLQVVVVIVRDLDSAPKRFTSLADHVLQLLVEAADALVFLVLVLVSDCDAVSSPACDTELPPSKASACWRRRRAAERECGLAGWRWECGCARERVFVTNNGGAFRAAGARDDGARCGTARDGDCGVAARARGGRGGRGRRRRCGRIGGWAIGCVGGRRAVRSGSGVGGGNGGRDRGCGWAGRRCRGDHNPAGGEATGSAIYHGLRRRGVRRGCVEAVVRAPHPSVLPARPRPRPRPAGVVLRAVGELARHVKAHVSLHLALKLHAIVLRGEERRLADAELPHATRDAANHVDDAALRGTAVVVVVSRLDTLPPAAVVVAIVVSKAPLPTVPSEGGPEGGVGVERVAHDILVRVTVCIGRGGVGGIVGAPVLETLPGGSESGGGGGLGVEGAVVLRVEGEGGGNGGEEGAGHGGRAGGRG